ncbi:hypothetical protein [Bacillus horti]|uniref:Cytosolic protein n=1 Tax=Caldalkalibacillus horti TaxID=77523 RepID=A0ABT9VTS9_9BACI|nr:hypothetical protein [Bacillus horti]MDQ0164284.1 hypothetical protein [Bacillus horti]
MSKKQENNNKNMEQADEQDVFTPLSTEYNYLHSRTLEEFPEGPYQSTIEGELGKTSGWSTGEEVNPRFSYENEELHESSERLDPQADPTRKNPQQKIR